VSNVRRVITVGRAACYHRAMRKRLFLFGSLLAALVLGGYLVLSTQRHAINDHAFAEIHVDLSEAEIERIFGAPGRPSSGLGNQLRPYA
jgi:hypothetical protein